METKNLNKLVTPRHIWRFSYNYPMYDIYWEMVFTVLSFVFGLLAFIALAYTDKLWAIITCYVCGTAMIVLFGISSMKLFRDLAMMVCRFYHVIAQNVAEQKGNDCGVIVAYCDPDTFKEYSEAEYEKMRCAEQQKERAHAYQENMRKGLEGEVERKKMEEKRQKDALEKLRNSTKGDSK